MKNYLNFEIVKNAKSRSFSKWHLFWVLFALNVVGFAAARFYFQEQDEQMKAESKAVEFSNKYGASVKGGHTLFTWGLELLQLLRSGN